MVVCSSDFVGECHCNACYGWEAIRSLQVFKSGEPVWYAASGKGTTKLKNLIPSSLFKSPMYLFFQSFSVLSTVLEHASEPDLPESLKDDIALVIVCADEEKKLLTARCTRKSCSDHCRNLKMRSGQLLGVRSEKCPHIKLSFDHLMREFPLHQFGMMFLPHSHILFWSNVYRCLTEFIHDDELHSDARLHFCRRCHEREFGIYYAQPRCRQYH